MSRKPARREANSTTALRHLFLGRASFPNEHRKASMLASVGAVNHRACRRMKTPLQKKITKFRQHTYLGVEAVHKVGESHWTIRHRPLTCLELDRNWAAAMAESHFFQTLSGPAPLKNARASG